MTSNYHLKDSFHLLKNIMKGANLLNEMDSFIGDRCPEEFDFWCSHPLACSALSSVPTEELLLEVLAKESSNPLVGNALSTEELVSYFGELTKEDTEEELHAWKGPALRLLGNISQLPHGRELIKNSRVLSSWVQEQSQKETPSLFLEAWKIIHNLRSHETQISYSDRLYPLCPPWEDQNAVADVIFIHGIKGGAAWTWRQHDDHRHKPAISQRQRRQILENGPSEGGNSALLENVYTWLWPLDWLAPSTSLPLRLLAVDYPAYWWRWTAGRHTPSDLQFDELCQELLEKLTAAGVGSRPIVWVAHSMGGLVVKNLLRLQKQDMSKDCKVKSNLLSSTRGVVFLSVPHRGTPLASWSCRFSPLFRPSFFVRYMKADSPELILLNEAFAGLCRENGIEVLSINERLSSPITKKGPSVLFVPGEYGDPGVGDVHEVDASHLNICKPHDRSSEIFILIKSFIFNVMQLIHPG